MESLRQFITARWPLWKDGRGMPMPVDLRHRDIRTEAASEYVVAHKYDGERFLFVVFQHRSFCVSRTGVAYKNGPVLEACGNLIFDGEMVQTSSGVQFSVFDCVVMNDVYVGDLPLAERLRLAESALTVCQPKAINVVLKPVFECSCLPEIQTADVTTDGFVFTHKTDPITVGRSANIKKWKPPDKQTVDVQCQDGMALYNDRGKLTAADLRWHALPVSNGIWECLLTRRDGVVGLVPLHPRKDKLMPNSVSTVTAVLDQVQDPISWDDLLTWSQKE